jgi:copper chaperone CopZ
MTCSGCSNAITTILNKIDGVASVECDVPAKTVTVHLNEANQPSIDLVESKINVWAEAADKPPAVRK